MAIITLPNNLAVAKGGVVWGQRRYDAATASEPSGSVQTRLYGVPRWSLRLIAPDTVTEEEAATWRALLLTLRGRVNHLAAWNPAQVVPRGTMRGTMTLNGSHSAGATTVAIIVSGTGQVGNTLLAGSPLEIGSGLTGQLVHTVSDATAINTAGNSTISVTVEPPLRTAYAGSTAVTWDKAKAHFKTTNDTTEWRHYDATRHQEFGLDLLENWT